MKEKWKVFRSFWYRNAWKRSWREFFTLLRREDFIPLLRRKMIQRGELKKKILIIRIISPPVYFISIAMEIQERENLLHRFLLTLNVSIFNCLVKNKFAIISFQHTPYLEGIKLLFPTSKIFWSLVGITRSWVISWRYKTKYLA